jgi:hypothetical protein
MTRPVHVHPHTNQREPRIMDYYSKNLITALGHAATWVWAVFTALGAVLSALGSAYLFADAADGGTAAEPNGLNLTAAIVFAVFGLVVGQLETSHKPLRCGWCNARAHRPGYLYHFVNPASLGQAVGFTVVIFAFVALVLYLNGWVSPAFGFALQAVGFAAWFTVAAAKLAHRNRRHCPECTD